ncbi:hypothetical protein Tco_0276916 [Tanacetum coccineum]
MDFSLVGRECNFFDIDDSYYEKSTSRLAHLASISPEIIEVCVDDDDTDDDDDYDDDFYDCVDIEEDGGEIDFDISKIVDISLREKLVERKDKNDKKKQKQSKTDKERKRQEKEQRNSQRSKPDQPDAAIKKDKDPN